MQTRTLSGCNNNDNVRGCVVKKWLRMSLRHFLFMTCQRQLKGVTAFSNAYYIRGRSTSNSNKTYIHIYIDPLDTVSSYFQTSSAHLCQHSLFKVYQNKLLCANYVHYCIGLSVGLAEWITDDSPFLVSI